MLNARKGVARYEAVEGLRSLGRASSEAVQEMLVALGDTACWQQQIGPAVYRDVGTAVARALRELGQADERAIDVVLPALDTDSGDVRSQALQILGELGDVGNRAIPAVLTALSDPHPKVRSSAANALGKMGCSDKRVAVALLAAMRDENARVRGAAATTLGMLRFGDKKVIGALSVALSDADVGVRHSSAEALGVLVRCSQEAVSAILEASRHQPANVNTEAALRRIDKIRRAHIAPLLRGIEDTDASVRERAARLLGKADRADNQACRALLQALRDRSASVRRAAAESLEGLSCTSDEMVGALAEALGDGDGVVCYTAVSVLKKLGRIDESMREALIAMLQDRDRLVECAGSSVLELTAAVSCALRKLGDADDQLHGALVPALDDEDDRVRESAARALGELRQTGGAAADSLLKALRDQSSGVRRAAVESLSKLGSSSVQVITAILETLCDDEDERVRESAARAVAELRQTGGAAVDPLLKALRDQSVGVRRAAIESLAKLGCPSTRVITAFVETVIADENDGVARAAAESLEALCAKCASISDEMRKLWPNRHRSPKRRLDVAMCMATAGEATPGVGIVFRDLLRQERDAVVAASYLERLCRAGTHPIGELVEAVGMHPDRARWLDIFLREIESRPCSLTERRKLEGNASRIAFYLGGDGQPVETEALEGLVEGCRDPGGPRVPDAEAARLILTAGTVSRLGGLLAAVRMNHAVALVGETGVGKTALVRFLASLTTHNYVRINLKDMAEVSELVGGYVPTEDGSLVWKDGLLVQAMKEGDWVVLDEANLAGPGVLERLNQLLDPDGQMELQECGNKDGEPIRPHPDFRLFVTMNPTDYAGRNAMSPAFVNRFVVKWFDRPSSAELTQIVAGKYGVDEDVARRLVTFHQSIADSAEHRELGRQRAERYVYTLRDLQAVMKRLRNGGGGNGGDLAAADVVRCVQDVYGARLSHKEDRDLFETHIKACFA